MSHKLTQFITSLKASFAEDNFVKLNLGHYVGPEDGLKTIIAKKAIIKREEKLSFTFRFKTRDIVKNYTMAEGLQLITTYLHDDFYTATLFTTACDWSYQNNTHGKITLTKTKPTITTKPNLAHDHAKTRLIEAAPQKTYLQGLGITDAKGEVYKNAQDKYKQINKYIEILSTLIKPQVGLKIADMGAGKGYLTFALYDYLQNLQMAPQIMGVEYRQDLVDLCNNIAFDAGFSGLQFVQGTIDAFDSTGTNVLIALHACNTATDDAIAKGIKAGAELIVVAPCCHKQIRQEIEKNKQQNDLDFLLKYGVFLERQAEMVTDGLRALILNYHGYSTKAIEFISDSHTPKNVMLVGTYNPKLKKHDPKILEQINQIKHYFGITQHYLESCFTP